MHNGEPKAVRDTPDNAGDGAGMAVEQPPNNLGQTRTAIAIQLIRLRLALEDIRKLEQQLQKEILDALIKDGFTASMIGEGTDAIERESTGPQRLKVYYKGEESPAEGVKKILKRENIPAKIYIVLPSCDQGGRYQTLTITIDTNPPHQPAAIQSQPATTEGCKE